MIRLTNIALVSLALSTLSAYPHPLFSSIPLAKILPIDSPNLNNPMTKEATILSSVQSKMATRNVKGNIPRNSKFENDELAHQLKNDAIGHVKSTNEAFWVRNAKVRVDEEINEDKMNEKGRKNLEDRLDLDQWDSEDTTNYESYRNDNERENNYYEKDHNKQIRSSHNGGKIKYDRSYHTFYYDEEKDDYDEEKDDYDEERDYDRFNSNSHYIEEDDEEYDLSTPKFHYNNEQEGKAFVHYYDHENYHKPLEKVFKSEVFEDANNQGTYYFHQEEQEGFESIHDDCNHQKDDQSYEEDHECILETNPYKENGRFQESINRKISKNEKEEDYHESSIDIDYQSQRYKSDIEGKQHINLDKMHNTTYRGEPYYNYLLS